MTLIRNVNALVTAPRKAIQMERAVVRFTSDNYGETLSLQAEGVMITVKYKDIEKIVARERSKGYKDGHCIVDESDEAIKEHELDGEELS